jgi:hypothetical protein
VTPPQGVPLGGVEAGRDENEVGSELGGDGQEELGEDGAVLGVARAETREGVGS